MTHEKDQFGGIIEHAQKDEFGGDVLELAPPPPTGPEVLASGVGKGFSTVAGGLVDIGAFQMETVLDPILRALAGRRGEPFEPLDINLPGGSESIREALGVIPEGEIPENLRAVEQIGEVFGAGAPLAVAPMLAARIPGLVPGLAEAGRGAGMLRGGPGFTIRRPFARIGSGGISEAEQVSGGLLPSIARTARDQPVQFAIAEAGGMFGAAQGTVLAESLAPGNLPARVAGEVAGGFLNPLGVLARFAVRSSIGARNFIFSQTRTGRERQAGLILQNLLIDAGEDPAAVIRALQETGQVPLTSGQQTGSPALLAMESKLAAGNAEFGNFARDALANAFREFRAQIDNLAASGDPENLRRAAIARVEFFEDILTQRLSMAQREAAETLATIPSGGTFAEASIQARNAVLGALKEARGIERSLWGKIPGDIRINTVAGLTQAVSNIRSGLILPEQNLPFDAATRNIIERFTRSLPGRDTVSIPGQPIPETGATVGDLLNLRSQMLDRQRTLLAENKFDLARQHGMIADGILDDLNSINIPVATEARQFSKILNDTFTRTFAASVSRTAGTGALRVSPELLLERAFGGGGTRAEIQFAELERAANLGDQSAAFRIAQEGGIPPIGQMFGADVANAQERFLALAAQRSVRDGVVNPQALAQFRENNATLLARFPELNETLSNAENAQRAFLGIQQANKQARRSVASRAAFSKVAGVENPSAAMGQIIQGPQPVQRFNQIARLAKGSGQGAVDGMQSAVLDWAIQQGRTLTGFNFQRFGEILTTPLSRRQPSVIGLMRQNGIVSGQNANNLERLITRGTNLQEALATGRNLDQLIENPDVVFDLVVRIAGARAGAVGLGGASGASLLAAQRGSAFARNFFEKVPGVRLTQVLEEAARNNRFAAALLQKAPTPKRRPLVQRQINAFLLQAGIISEEDR